MTITIQHPSITSPLFELAKTVEFNLEVAEDHFSLRVELFQDISNAQRFRARIWRLEMYRIQSTFPQNETDGQPADQPSDESIFVDTGAWLSQRYEDFRAETPDRAIQIILNDLRDFLVRASGGSEKILS
jgi:hypothetical protein